jgi:hypothetical protein
LTSHRKPLAEKRRLLLEQTDAFEAELMKMVDPWASQTDPITGRPWLALLEKGSDDVPWRKRLGLFNRRFLEFVITEDGRFYVCTSDGVHEHYGQGFTLPSAVTHMELRLEQTRNGSRIGTPLLMVVEEHVERLAQMPDLQAGGAEVGGR